MTGHPPNESLVVCGHGMTVCRTNENLYLSARIIQARISSPLLSLVSVVILPPSAGHCVYMYTRKINKYTYMFVCMCVCVCRRVLHVYVYKFVVFNHLSLKFLKLYLCQVFIAGILARLPTLATYHLDKATV